MQPNYISCYIIVRGSSATIEQHDLLRADAIFQGITNQGVIVQILNSKAVLFFFGILPQFSMALRSWDNAHPVINRIVVGIVGAVCHPLAGGKVDRHYENTEGRAADRSQGDAAQREVSVRGKRVEDRKHNATQRKPDGEFAGTFQGPWFNSVDMVGSRWLDCSYQDTRTVGKPQFSQQNRPMMSRAV